MNEAAASPPVDPRPPLARWLGRLVTLQSMAFLAALGLVSVEVFSPGEVTDELLRRRIALGGIAGLTLWAALGGVALTGGRRWARRFLIAQGWLFLPAAPAALIAWRGGVERGATSTTFFLLAIAMGCAAVFTLVALLMAHFSSLAVWTAPSDPGDPGERRTSTGAILSLVFALIPSLPTAILALVLGLLALGNIRRARGVLGGAALAVAGIVVSLLLLLVLWGVAWTLAIIPALNLNQQREHDVETLRLAELDVELRVHRDLVAGAGAAPVDLAEVLTTVGNRGPLDPDTRADIMLADVARHGANAEPWNGHLFRLASYTEEGAPARPMLVVWPAELPGTAWALDADGILRKGRLSLPPPAKLSAQDLSDDFYWEEAVRRP